MDFISLDFVQNSIYASILISLICGIIGSLVVINRIVFLAGGIAHTAYAGVGLAFYFKIPILLATNVVAIISSMLMALITIKKNEHTETVIGALWAAGMAIGIILIDLTPGYNVDLMSYLFGSILTVSKVDIITMLILSIIIILLTLIFYRHFLIMSFDKEYAATRGVAVLFLHFLLLSMVAVSIVMIIRVVGLILVIALLSIPPFLAQKFSNSLWKMMLISALWSLLFSLTGLYISFKYNITSGASIIAVASTVFFIVVGYDKFFKRSC
jgi:zinc transport system permease protein